MRACGWCREDFDPARVGHVYCSTRCRVAAHREGRRAPPISGAQVPLAFQAPAGPARLVAPSPVAALYVRGDTVYRHVDGVAELWPRSRNAKRYAGPWPVVAHPPCAPWGRYRHFGNVTQDPSCGPAAVRTVRTWGGVLEHPAGSALWAHCGLPAPGGGVDGWGGYSVLVRQGWWGHPAPKPTWLYVVGPACLPPVPRPVAAAARIDDLPRRERESTPPAFARWLVALASTA